MRTVRALWLSGLVFCFSHGSSSAATLLGVDWDSGELFNVSTVNASMTLIGNTGVPRLSALEFSPSGQLYGFTSGATSSLYRVDPNTAAATLLGPLGVFVFEGGLAFSPSGIAYGLGGAPASGSVQQVQLFTLDPATGAATPGPILSGDAHDVNGLAWRSDGMLVGLDRRSGGLITIDPVSGSTTLLAALATNIGATGGMTALGNLGYFSTSGPGDIIPGSNRLYSFDLGTGAPTLIGTITPFTSGTGLGGLAIIPEPGMLALLATALAVMARRKPSP